MKCCSAWIVSWLLAAAFVAHGQTTPEDQYVRIYGLIQEADALNDQGDSGPAVTKYLDAQNSLKNLQTANPDWNERIVKYRLNYVSTKLEPLLRKSPPPGTSFALSAPSTGTNQSKVLVDEISRLTAQNALLEAKLKEALSVQPAALDPRELAKAQEKIKQIEKERDLMKVALDQERAKVRPANDRATAEEERKLVAELKKKLGDQTALTEAAQKENQSLQQQIAELKLSRPATNALAPVPADPPAFASLEASNKMLRTELILLENRLSDFVRQSAVKPPATGKDNTQKQLAAAQADIKALERERDDLQRQLAAAVSSSGKRTPPPTGKSAADLRKQLDTARARIQVLEAKPIPYSAEELALFKQPPLKLAATASAGSPTPPAPAPSNEQPNAAPSAPAPKRTAPELPAGSGPLIAEARRAIEGGRLDDAEKKYLDVLRQDENNTYVLANLAAVQLDQNRLDAAEKTLARALANGPEDSAALYLVGNLKFRQEKYDEALDALSLSAKLNPQEAQTQFVLGQVLLQKGERKAAETALRQAIQLKPGWGDAHYTLAVMYSAQQPPFKELAEWHYKRAIAGGAPRNVEFEQWMEKQATARR